MTTMLMCSYCPTAVPDTHYKAHLREQHPWANTASAVAQAKVLEGDVALDAAAAWAGTGSAPLSAALGAATARADEAEARATAAEQETAELRDALDAATARADEAIGDLASYKAQHGEG